MSTFFGVFIKKEMFHICEISIIKTIHLIWRWFKFLNLQRLYCSCYLIITLFLKVLRWISWRSVGTQQRKNVFFIKIMNGNRQYAWKSFHQFCSSEELMQIFDIMILCSVLHMYHEVNKLICVGTKISFTFKICWNLLLHIAAFFYT